MKPLHLLSSALPAGALALLVGSGVLTGWALDIAALKSVLPGWVSMKPNTALAFILTGLALLTGAYPQRPIVLARLSQFCALFTGLIGLLSLAEYAAGWTPGFDQWLFPEPGGTVGTSNPGRMAPDTALCFVLFAAGWEFARRPRQTEPTRIAALLFGAAISAVALVEIMSYFAPALRTYGWGGLTMMALPTASLFAALGLVLIQAAALGESSAPDLPAQPLERSDTRVGMKFVLVFVALTVGIIAVGGFYYRNYERQFHLEAEQQLLAIAELKVSELVQYRRERLGDAATFHNNPAFTQLARRFLASPADADAQRQLQAWLGKYQTHYQYDRLFLLDAQGRVRLSVPESPEPVAAVISARVAEVLRSGQPVFQDFYRHELDQRIYLSLLVPLHDNADSNRPLGVLVLQIDPNTYLYPFIRAWPVPSATAETLLVRREGSEVAYLNQLRFQSNTALTLRRSLSQTQTPTVRAALGQQGIVEGVDYRGVQVLAALRAVPDSPWFLVARRDLSEVNTPLLAQLWQVIVVVGVLLFGAGAVVGLVWRQQRVRFYRERVQTAEALTLSQDLLAQAEALGKVGGWEFAIDTRQLTWTKGVYDIHEIDSSSQQSVDQGVNYYTPASRPVIERAVQRAIELGEPFDLELEIITAKGNLRNVHTIGQANLTQRKVWGFFQDITERTQAEAALRASEERYHTIFSTMFEGFCVIEVLFDEEDRPNDYLFLEINPAFEAQTGLRNAQGKRMRELAPQHEAYWFELYGKVALTGEPIQFENEAKELHRFYRVSAYQVGGQGSRKVGIMFTDISERKQAEQATLESRRAAIDLMQDAVEARKKAETLNATLAEQLGELRRWQQVTLGREGRVLAMKKEVNALLAEQGQPPRYPSAVPTEDDQ